MLDYFQRFLITERRYIVRGSETLGIDIGGVIIDRVNDRTDTSFFGNNYLQTTAVPYAFECIRELVERRFSDQVYLVSKCGRRIQERTLEWLNHHHFYDRCIFVPENVRFCRERHEKAGICEELRITHFIDDRLEVLSHLTSVDTLFLFQPQPNEVKRFAQHLSRVRQVQSWQEIKQHLLS